MMGCRSSQDSNTHITKWLSDLRMYQTEVNHKKFDAVCHITRGQKPFKKPTHTIKKLCQHKLNTCTALNYVTVLKFEI